MEDLIAVDNLILEQNFFKLEFINGIAIYGDSSRGIRKNISDHKTLQKQNGQTPSEYHDFESWLSIFCEKNDIERSEIVKFKSMVDEILNKEFVNINFS